MKRTLSSVLLGTLLIIAFTEKSNALDIVKYSENYDDINRCNTITQFSDYSFSEMTFIFDKSFVPISCVSKEKSEYQGDSIFHWFTDIFQYFKFPLDNNVGVNILFNPYFSQDEHPDYTKFTKFLKNIHLEKNETSNKNIQEWVTILDEASKKGAQIWKQFGGDYGELNDTQPIGILLYTDKDSKKRALIVINFVYSDIDRKLTGQFLFGLNISANTKELVGEHIFYTTGDKITKAFNKYGRSVLDIIVKFK